MTGSWQPPEEEQLRQQLARLTAQEAVDYLNRLAQEASQHVPQRTAEFARQAYERALQLGYQAGSAEAARLLGVAALFAGDYAQAHRWFEHAFALFHQLQMREKALHTLVNWALAFHATGDYARAAQCLQQAFQEEISQFPELYLKALVNTGIVYADLGHYERALQAFEEAIVQARQQGARQTLARALNNAALLYAERGEHARALELQLESMKLKEELGDQYGVAIGYATLGHLYMRMGQAEEAETAYRRSLALRQQLGDRRGMGYVLANLGQLYRQQGRLEEAQQMLEQAAQIAAELHETVLDLEVSREKALLSQRLGDWHAATYLLNRCLRLSEQLRSEQVQQALAQLQMRYELERQRREQEEIQRLLVEWQYRALQAQVNPHFLFNVLTTVQLALARNDAEGAQQLLRRLALLMRQVLQSSQRGLIRLAEELQMVELYLQIEHQRFQGAFQYRLWVSPEVEPEEVWCPPLLLQPLVENALKHGLGPRGGRGTVRVEVEPCQECVLCVIEDDGVGRQTGQELPGHLSAGLRLTQERLRLLSRKLGKEFQLRILDLTHPDGGPAGTRVEVLLPQELDFVQVAPLVELIPTTPKPVFSPVA